GATRDEAARRLGLSLGTLKRRLDRGRSLLRDRLVRPGLGPSSGLVWVLLLQGAGPPCTVQAIVRPPALEGAGRWAEGVISQTAAVLAQGAAAPLGRAWPGVALLLLAGALMAAGVGLAPRHSAGEQPPPAAGPPAQRVAPPERGAETPKE